MDGWILPLLSLNGVLAGVGSPGSRLLSEEQFSCSICLEVFVEPVSTPCGHSFCKACLQGYWEHSKKFVCPMCKKTYSRKPEMSVNRVLAEISSQFQGLVMSGGADGAGASSRGSTLNLSSDSAHVGSPDRNTGSFAQAGEVPCDACIGRKLKAYKSCVNCRGSFCETHLRHHKKVCLLGLRLFHYSLITIFCKNILFQDFSIIKDKLDTFIISIDLLFWMMLMVTYCSYLVVHDSILELF